MSLPHVPLQSAEAVTGPLRLSPALAPNQPLSVSSTTGPMPVPRPSPQGPRLGPQHPIMDSTAAPANKIVGRNLNGTLVMTSAPANEAELQLYRVMQRASLLAYYDTLLEMGGDDVQQLCEAGEEEFLEIMALVGMASKPLHVRRLQKALQEWVNNPALFQTPLLPQLPTPGLSTSSSPLSHESAHSPSRPMNLSSTHAAPVPPPAAVAPPVTPSPAPPQTSPVQVVRAVRGSPSPQLPKESGGSTGSVGGGSSNGAPSPGLNVSPEPRGAAFFLTPQVLQVGAGPESMSPGSPPPLQLTPSLGDVQISRLADAAKVLANSLPTYEPKPQNSKKRICKDLEFVMNMAEDDPRRMDEIRKYAAIYGRFDCKRKPEKPLTLHEVSVNEAAAQICKLVPALLTRRDELFPLARQVVRDSGYQYSKTHVSFMPGCPSLYQPRGNGADDLISSSSSSKRLRLAESIELSDFRRQERLEQISEELRAMAERQEELRQLANGGGNDTWQSQLEALQTRQAQLAVEQAELGRHAPSTARSSMPRRSARISGASYGDEHTDDTDSQLSYSNASSPSQDVGDSRDSSTKEGEENRLRKGISKQLVQETLLDEGLRVVKEMVANHNKGGRFDDCGDRTSPPHAHTNHHHRPPSSRSNHRLPHAFENFYDENKVQVGFAFQVISASGTNIIAVANPALSMSPAMLEEEAKAVRQSNSPLQLLGLGQAFKQEPLSPSQ
ncbi:NGFI-A-binding protein homolog isoform X2 [Neocloeon triangulifer]|uniref:NGFI-A-binding protein homolog isoform X2 n=1 Tax=Neocloeon triangulifer TaxID=2078957 RepID=UPI00286ED177|nr:NGFI-A-binding protein homolog isoform X2 [Neocloeon triangulifer]